MLRLATEGLGRWLTESEKWRSRAEFWNEVEVILSEGDSLVDNVGVGGQE